MTYCSGCGADPGEIHDELCDWARCPDCGEQLAMHDFAGECEEGDERPAVWHGIDQRTEVARQLNWWTTAAGIEHLVEDDTRVVVAIALGQITWDRDSQRYTVGDVDNARIDQALGLTPHP